MSLRASVAKTIWGVFGSFVAAFIFVCWADANGAENGEHFVQACDRCHLAQIEITNENADKLFASQEYLCARCHAESMKVSHPSGIKVSGPLPEGFPLDWKGDMTCSTCHDVHAKVGNGLMRSEKRGRDLCFSCHDDSFFQRMRDGGTSLMLSGHLASNLTQFAGIDTYSIQCIECHEEESAAPNVLIDKSGVIRHGSGSSNHPIGVSYQKAYSYGGYRPRTSLPAEVITPNGNLSCVSCHLGYSQEHGKLIRPYPGMCSMCHDL